eukprot:Tamp_19679.p1 GENE.Tamp_19679~~Tamp_19679.p1  ORF type:complete len:165 (+),score=18.58 Tamp_19679:143-637(+)
MRISFSRSSSSSSNSADSEGSSGSRRKGIMSGLLSLSFSRASSGASIDADMQNPGENTKNADGADSAKDHHHITITDVHGQVWESLVDDSGVAAWINEATGELTTLKPKPRRKKTWEVASDTDGNAYWIHPETRKVQWTRPQGAPPAPVREFEGGMRMRDIMRY